MTGGLSRQVQMHVKCSLLPHKSGLIRQVVFSYRMSLTQFSLYIVYINIVLYTQTGGMDGTLRIWNIETNASSTTAVAGSSPPAQ